MRTLLILCLASTFLLANCQETKYFGETFETENAISVDKLVKQIEEDSPTEALVVAAKVDEVCQVKGCWMTVSTEDGTSMRVTFKDYGFFVPMDIDGKNVIFKGSGEVAVTSVADLRHYAEDEGKSEEEIAAITEPEEEYVFVADGVFLVE